MQPKARITAIRLQEKVSRQPEYAKRIGLSVKTVRKSAGKDSPGYNSYERPNKKGQCAITLYKE